MKKKNINVLQVILVLVIFFNLLYSSEIIAVFSKKIKWDERDFDIVSVFLKY